MWYLERKNNSEMFPSLWEALWWTVVTVVTVGYGDKTPNRGKNFGYSMDVY